MVGEDGSGASQFALHAAWSSLTFGRVNNREMLFGVEQMEFVTDIRIKPLKMKMDMNSMSPYGRLIVMSQVTEKIKREKKIPYATPPDQVN